MKKRYVKLIFIACFFIFTNTVFSEDRVVFTVGVEEIDYLPYFSGKNNKYNGFSRELLDLFAKTNGYHFKYRVLPLKRLLNEFLTNKIDFKFPDNPDWKTSKKQGIHIIYSNPVMTYTDGLIVLPENKGKGIKNIRRIGTIRGFTVSGYSDLLENKSIRLYENTKFSGLLKQALTGRVDGVYINLTVGEYQLNEMLMQPDTLVFDPDLPHNKSFYTISSITHPLIIKDFNHFLTEQHSLIDALKRKFKIEQKRK